MKGNQEEKAENLSWNNGDEKWKEDK